ncbi:hypothetical protein [Halegenticoccus tardaugens]|nr:hypothetical protein [Halegenticoccus tardaugens]
MRSEFEGLDAARHPYEERGFELGEEDVHDEWGPEVRYRWFERVR